MLKLSCLEAAFLMSRWLLLRRVWQGKESSPSCPRLAGPQRTLCTGEGSTAPGGMDSLAACRFLCPVCLSAPLLLARDDGRAVSGMLFSSKPNSGPALLQPRPAGPGAGLGCPEARVLSRRLSGCPGRMRHVAHPPALGRPPPRRRGGAGSLPSGPCYMPVQRTLRA